MCGKNKQEKLRATIWQIHDFYICHENHESVTQNNTENTLRPDV